MAGDDDHAPLIGDEDLECRARRLTESFLTHSHQFHGTNVPLVEIKWFKGRDDKIKAKTIELVTKLSARPRAVAQTPLL